MMISIETRTQQAFTDRKSFFTVQNNDDS